MSKRIYLDHAAATPLDPKVLEVMQPFLSGAYGNPSGIHQEGVLARKAIEGAREVIAKILDGHADEIIFTGSATESANLALVGSVRAWQEAHPGKKPHIIVSAIEHDAVFEPVSVLERAGVRVTRIGVNSEGIINLGELKDALTMETVLVSVMYANNEIGTIQPIEEIAKIIRKWKKEYRGVVRTEKAEGDARYPLFHTDACQAANYCALRIPKLGVDLMTLNAAKVYGPKGIGLLYALREVPLLPMIVGGHQERGLRAGTENVSGIIGFARALHLAQAVREEESLRLSAIRDAGFALLEKITPHIVINGGKPLRLPNNINFSIRGVDHEFLALALDAQGFAVATKSACNELDAETSHVLEALGGENKSGIRLSLGRNTTLANIEHFIEVLKNILATMIFRDAV